jgi:molybdenum cofactor cytidylyltransferase
MQRETDKATKKEEVANIGIIVLAAGFSKRLGQPKQLLLYKGQTLLQQAAQTALASGAGPVLVVLGARAEELKNEIKESTINMVVNKEWPEGMASSIRCGVEALVALDPAVAGLILMVCDQPFVTASLLCELVAAHRQTGKPIVACSYAGTYGPPVFFHRTLFPELLQLKGDVGARGVIKQYANAVETIPFPEGTIDIDTEKDYERLSEKEGEL